ncbi:hypothetical protein RRG08_010902 [Elysia crispata]|uniref:Uncharacterized protein n=1 Tax=Elysia crispata TaxID=231223 RepID=A0AAE1DQJ8_9GAST|nr:hypothetical protein RRG08_010902 [Elysia crispata]
MKSRVEIALVPNQSTPSRDGPCTPVRPLGEVGLGSADQQIYLLHESRSVCSSRATGGTPLTRSPWFHSINFSFHVKVTLTS